MKFNPNPLEFLKKRAEQSALKEVINKYVDEFRRDLSFAGEVNLNTTMQLRYDGMEMEKFLNLKSAVASLHGNSKRILERFPLSEDVSEIVKNIEKISREINELEKSQELISKWEMSDKKGEIKLTGDLASNLASKMQNLWAEIHKLKKAGFPSILSTKIRTSK